MLPALIFIGAAVVIYLLSQGITGQQADAEGHDETETEECMRERLSFDALVSLAQEAGFDLDSKTAAAIALAESGGDPNAYNAEKQDIPGRYGRANEFDGLGSYGLWQIYRAAHPELDGQDLTDPQTNAAAAFSIYSASGGFKAWSTFKSGNYQRFLT